MAWTAPASWSVSEIVIASKMNAQIRDNLKYLKGQAGAVAIEDNVGVVDVAPTSDWTPTTQYLTVATAASPGSAGVALKGARSGSDSAFAALYGVNLAATGSDKTGGAVSFNRDGAADSANISFSTRNAGTVAERARIDKAGNVGIGTTTPQGKLHAVGAGGGFMFLSASAVTSLQTLAAAGTVTSAASIFAWDHNNTGGGNVLGTQPVLVGLAGSMAIVNTDTITIAVTAGGGITVQRTSGTNGTHDVNMIVIYR